MIKLENHIQWGYLLNRGTTWKDLKLPTMSKKRPEITHNKQEITWNELQPAQQGTTWNDLKRARNDLKWFTTSKQQPETTWNNLERTRNDLLFIYFLNWFQTFSTRYFLWVLSLTTHLRVGKAVSQWQQVETLWKLIHLDCNFFQILLLISLNLGCQFFSVVDVCLSVFVFVMGRTTG